MGSAGVRCRLRRIVETEGGLVKNIIVCCDGTGNEFESNVTNVVETYALATKNAQ